MSRARSIKSNKLTGVKLSGIKKCFAFKPLPERSSSMRDYSSWVQLLKRILRLLWSMVHALNVKPCLSIPLNVPESSLLLDCSSTATAIPFRAMCRGAFSLLLCVYWWWARWNLWPWWYLPGGRGRMNSGCEAGWLLSRFKERTQTTNYNIHIHTVHFVHVNHIFFTCQFVINHSFHFPYNSPNCSVFTC